MPPFALGMSNKKFDDHLHASPNCPTTAAKTNEFRTPMSDVFTTPNSIKGPYPQNEAQSQGMYFPGAMPGQADLQGKPLAYATPAKDAANRPNHMAVKNGPHYGYGETEKEESLQARESAFHFAAKEASN